MQQPHPKPSQWQYYQPPIWQNVRKWHQPPIWQNVPQWHQPPIWQNIPQWHQPDPWLIHQPPGVQFNQPPVQLAGNQPPVGQFYLPSYPNYQPSVAKFGWQPSAAYQRYYKLPIPNPPNSIGQYYSDLPSYQVFQPPEPVPRPIDPPASQKVVQPSESIPRPIDSSASQKVVQLPKPILRPTDPSAGQLKQKSVRFSALPRPTHRPISKQYHPYLPRFLNAFNEPQPTPPCNQQPVVKSSSEQPVAGPSNQQPLANPSEINRLFATLDYERLLDVNCADQPDFEDFKKLLNELACEKLKQQELPNQAPPPASRQFEIDPDMLTWLHNVKFTIERFPEPAAFANDPEKLIERHRPVLKKLVDSMIAHHRAIPVQPAATPAADAPSGGPAGSDGSKRSDEMPIATNNQDLVLVHWNLWSFNNNNNNWMPSERVDEAVVRYCYGTPPDLIRPSLSKVKRMKIIGFRRKHLHELLLELSRYSELLELHIDTLKLTRGENVAYRFSSLRTLSIDVVRMVDEFDKEIEEEEGASLVTFNAPKLNAIFIPGSHHLQFPESKPFLLTTDRFPANLRESRFRDLLVLSMNRVRNENLPTIWSIVRGELLPLLARFYLMNCESTLSEAEKTGELLRRLHWLLKAASNRGLLKPWLSVYVDSATVANQWI